MMTSGHMRTTHGTGSRPFRGGVPLRATTGFTLAARRSGHPVSPGFLIHDPDPLALWERAGVRVACLCVARRQAGHARIERQRALALELAASESLAHGFQYICTLNSDYVPWAEFTPGFNPEDYIRLRLTDADVAGCLMGVRF